MTTSKRLKRVTTTWIRHLRTGQTLTAINLLPPSRPMTGQSLAPRALQDQCRTKNLFRLGCRDRRQLMSNKLRFSLRLSLRCNSNRCSHSIMSSKTIIMFSAASVMMRIQISSTNKSFNPWGNLRWSNSQQTSQHLISSWGDRRLPSPYHRLVPARFLWNLRLQRLEWFFITQHRFKPLKRIPRLRKRRRIRWAGTRTCRISGRRTASSRPVTLVNRAANLN